MRVLVTGGTGFLGRPLVRRLLKAGHSVRVLSRNVQAAEGMLPKEADAFTWQPPEEVPPAALQGVDAVAHCLGENVGKWPWTKDRKKAFRESRVDSTRALVGSLAALPAASRPKVLVSASAVGYYGDGGEDWKKEGDAPGKGFLAGLVRDWEAEVLKAEGLGIRTVALRLGVVLGDGGALEKMMTPFSMGLGASVGSGRQYFSWIHRTDAAEAFIFAMGADGLRGPVNACAPEPLTNKAFSKALARALRRPCLFRAPGFALSLALGEMARETLLIGQRADCGKLKGAGYPFRFPDLEDALGEILAHRRSKRF